ncbi:50S ribosomal protein L10, partial [candidate division KSB1 bacterium]
MAHPKKVAVVEELNKKLSEAKGIYLTDFVGLDVELMNLLRKQFRAQSIEYKVVKNTLLKRALKDLPFRDVERFLKGPNALAISYDDPIKPAKILTNFKKKYEKPEIKASVIEGHIFDLEETKAIAELPSKEELIAKLIMILQSPIYRLVFTLQGVLRNFLYVLN